MRFIVFSLVAALFSVADSAALPPSVESEPFSWQPDVILRITNEIIYPDCTGRHAPVANGSNPGPTLRFKEGEHIWVRVYNDLQSENTTMHWHGLAQRASPFSDGTALASQWPIPPGHFFDYEFKLEIGDAGSFFYHSHIGVQAMSVVGALIIEETDTIPPFHYDEDRILLLGEAYHKTDPEIVEGLLGAPLIWPGEPTNLLVNGKALGVCNDSSVVQGVPVCGKCSHSVTNLDPEKTYRIRFIGAMGLSTLFVGIEGHEMVLIEVDGGYISPHPIDHLEISSGQRYSVLVKAKTKEQLAADKSGGRYWLRMETRWRHPPRVNGYSLISYSDDINDRQPVPSNISKTVPLPLENFGWIDHELQPLAGTELDLYPKASEVTRRVILNSIQEKRADGSVRWLQNGELWDEETETDVPYLVSLYLDREAYFPNYTAALMNGGLDPHTKTYPAKLGEVLEIVIQNFAGPSGTVEAHPWHVHGAHGWDMGCGKGKYTPEALEESLATRKGKPFRRDTSLVYASPGATYTDDPIKPGEPGGWRVLRLKVTQPGVWMVHCHILPHMVMGMQTAWIFGDEDQLMPLPPMFAKNYLEYGGKAYGTETREAVRVEFWGNFDNITARSL